MKSAQLLKEAEEAPFEMEASSIEAAYSKPFVKPGESIPQDYGTTVVVIRSRWGTSGVPERKVDYLDHTEFYGGVARNVSREVAQKWLDHRRLGIYVLPEESDESNFIKATGVTPMEPEKLVAMIRALKPEELAALLGDENALKLANGLRRGLSAKAMEAK